MTDHEGTKTRRESERIPPSRSWENDRGIAREYGSSYETLGDASEICTDTVRDRAGNYHACGRSFAVHSELGSGLLESVYESCQVMELESQSVKVERQVAVPLIYKGAQVDDSLKRDLLMADLVVCELKALHEMHPVYKAQLMWYLKLSGRCLGFLINFNVERIKDSIT